MATPINYYDGLNQKLYNALPKNAHKVLELGCANGYLGKLYKEVNPNSTWWGLDLSAQALETASQHLDQVFAIDLDCDSLTTIEKGFDLIVIGDLLEHLKNPEKVLDALYDLATQDAKIVCCLPNMAHLSVLERILGGDFSYDDMGLLDKTHVRFYSPGSAFKIFLDSGWLPHLQDSYHTDLPQTPFVSKIIEAANMLGVPAMTAQRNLCTYQMIIVCVKWPAKKNAEMNSYSPFSVIVPVNRKWELDLNIARSPGLREVGAEIICVTGADNAASAFASGAQRATNSWRVMVHQDVYFPPGSGFALAKKLGELEKSANTSVPIGFAGMDIASDGSARYSGMVIDRTALFWHEGSTRAISLDEFAIVLHKDCLVKPDPILGWHTWGTDLCLQLLQLSGQPKAQILEIPLFHNSLNPGSLPPEFMKSAELLLAKYPNMEKINTLCGVLGR